MKGSRTLYPDSAATTNLDSGRYGVRKAIEKLKAEVSIETYADELTQLRNYGKELRGHCPIHQGNNPTSFSVNVEKQVFHCHACQWIAVPVPDSGIPREWVDAAREAHQE